MMNKPIFFLGLLCLASFSVTHASKRLFSVAEKEVQAGERLMRVCNRHNVDQAAYFYDCAERSGLFDQGQLNNLEDDLAVYIHQRQKTKIDCTVTRYAHAVQVKFGSFCFFQPGLEG